jgi:hypothetical protein
MATAGGTDANAVGSPAGSPVGSNLACWLASSWTDGKWPSMVASGMTASMLASGMADDMPAPGMADDMPARSAGSAKTTKYKYVSKLYVIYGMNSKIQGGYMMYIIYIHHI